MNLIGALIGAVIGYWLGGPFGMILGAILGQSVTVGVSRGGWSGHDSARAQQAFFTATFSVMGHVAKADGVVSEDEIQAANAVMSHMNLDPAQRLAAIQLFNRGKEAGFDLDAALRALRLACHGRRDLLGMFLQIQLHAALADGVIEPAERRVLERICDMLGIPEYELNQYEQFIRAQQRFRGGAQGGNTGRGNTGGGFRDMRTDNLAAAYQTLGVATAATDAEIKTAYRRLMKENHPDKLVARGLPENMIRMAQEKVQQINVAYDAVKAARGIK
ncbi:MAG TPA: co-chaperone DjlA [Gammaproteobacteria bacterium]|nr:co-chaperone DjlA [Gammaproteobacteria bacterium]